MRTVLWRLTCLALSAALYCAPAAAAPGAQTIEALLQNGFEVKAAIFGVGYFIYLQKGASLYVCYSSNGTTVQSCKPVVSR